jgi:uncharacterized membrane protein YphA (DoxX/SURF4 family)
MHRLLWILQILLALVFLFAGVSKMVMSAAELTGQSPLPAAFLRFIGVLEILGGLGLVLPGMLHIRPELTPLAAAGLSVIMIGAVVVTVQTMGFGLAILPFVIGVLVAFTAYGRWRLAPLGSPAGRVLTSTSRSKS